MRWLRARRGHVMQLRVLLVAIACLGPAACTPAGMGFQAGTTTAYALSRSDGPLGAISDTSIRLQINHYWLQRSEEILSKVGLLVQRRRVLLTGFLPTPEMRIEAERLVWNAEGVEAVFNEIRIGEFGTLADQGADILITKAIKATLLLDPDVRSANYEVDAVDRVVYVLGTASSEREHRHVVARAGDMAYVRNVVSRVSVPARSP